MAMLKGEKATGTVHGDKADRDVPSILLDPTSITKDTVKDVIADGGQKTEDVCSAKSAQLCADVAIS